MAEVRFIIDVSMLIRAGGTATGISRVSRELSQWALANCPNARLATLDWLYNNEVLRLLDNHVAPSLLDKTAVIDTFLIPDRYRADKIRVREYLPLPLRFVLMSIQHPRRAILILLERWRQRTTSADLAARIGRVQDRFMTEKHLRMMSTPTGERSLLVGYYKALRPFDPKPDDILLLTGADWGTTSPELYAELKAKHGIRIVWMCYDIIPLLYPHFFKESVARDFKRYADGLLAIADVVLVSARAIQSDLVEYCKQAGLRQPETRIVPFGADLTQSLIDPQQPPRHGLRARPLRTFRQHDRASEGASDAAFRLEEAVGRGSAAGGQLQPGVCRTRRLAGG